MPDEDPEQAAAREDLCRWLAACYYEPDAVLAEEKVFDAMASAADRLDAELGAGARRLGDAFAAAGLPALVADYQRLFVGPGEPLARPLGFAWLGDGEPPAAQASTIALEGLYAEAGFEIDEEAGEVPDHVALELEFLYLLTHKGNEARRGGHQEVIAGWAQLHSLFLAGHLGAWIGRFAAAVIANAETAFYRELAALTARFVQTGVERLSRR
ncbi:molecular chaperone TorD family protein [Ramlibacter sp.]|uniref:TorD/DmsD family molecular chaperone n=1 Tax=Ramlibacter sp. TaxID=1917967 RepID=UPI002C134BBE|nr:molecular chaperone TorD family protein [Ramlibacter sp.]HWI82952.1 molecular chaperone TorD family protein [Ramlibacter sp.]